MVLVWTAFVIIIGIAAAVIIFIIKERRRRRRRRRRRIIESFRRHPVRNDIQTPPRACVRYLPRETSTYDVRSGWDGGVNKKSYNSAVGCV